MISFEAARTAVLALARPLPECSVPLASAVGLRLARDVCAETDLPPTARSAMDGYAVRCGDLATTPATLRLVGEVAAGSPARPRVEPGTCVRVLTGAVVPPAAEAVAVVESTEEVSDDEVRFLETTSAGRHIREPGSDAKAGDLLLRAGTRLDAPQMALLAGVGVDPVPVRRMARVGLLRTGRELVAPETSAKPHQTRDADGPGLLAALRGLRGVEVEDLGIVTDDLGPLREAMAGGLERLDVLLVTGGVSVGCYDLVADALQAEGCEPVFHGVSQKPGKPTLFGRMPRDRLVFGLPGTPLGAFASFFNFVRPALDALTGRELDSPELPLVQLTGIARGHRSRTRFVVVRLGQPNGDGLPTATPVPCSGSADLAALGQADGAVVVPIGEEFTAGERASFVPWRGRP